MQTIRTTMRAFARREYGPPNEVLELEERATPDVGDDQVLIEVRATSVNAADWHMLVGTPYLVRLDQGLRSPKKPSLGLDVAGVVVAAGKEVGGVRPGDEVFGEVSGAYAEYALGRPSSVAPKPGNVTFEQAAAVPVAGLTALQGLRDHGKLQEGQHVLINGASGGVGTFAIQIAKALGAEVTAVVSCRNVETARSLGADHVIDYTAEDFTKLDQRFDLILDSVGNRPLAALRRRLADDGTYVMVSGPKGNWLGPVPRMLAGMTTFLFSDRTFAWFVAKVSQPDLAFLAELLEAGKVTPLVEQTYSFDELPAALDYLGDGHSRGKSVITVGPLPNQEGA